MIASNDSFDPSSQDQLPNSKRVYVNGKSIPIFACLPRDFPKPTRSLSGETENNAPVRVTTRAAHGVTPTLMATSQRPPCPP
ncbi:MAG: hypothetical protein Ct9H300mP7_4730 [Verrucomicrobiota bacterium]|nr:MAG: hypothetical protein Ct9H300mP7_4730 [Verrucomicrobiota bacterium]